VIPIRFIEAARVRPADKPKRTAWDLWAEAVPLREPHHATAPKPCYDLAENRLDLFKQRPSLVKR
jgi:hypothetical protein